MVAVVRVSIWTETSTISNPDIFTIHCLRHSIPLRSRRCVTSSVGVLRLGAPRLPSPSIHGCADGNQQYDRYGNSDSRHCTSRQPSTSGRWCRRVCNSGSTSCRCCCRCRRRRRGRRCRTTRRGDQKRLTKIAITAQLSRHEVGQGAVSIRARIRVAASHERRLVELARVPDLDTPGIVAVLSRHLVVLVCREGCRSQVRRRTAACRSCRAWIRRAASQKLGRVAAADVEIPAAGTAEPEELVRVGHGRRDDWWWVGLGTLLLVSQGRLSGRMKLVKPGDNRCRYPGVVPGVRPRIS